MLTFCVDVVQSAGVFDFAEYSFKEGRFTGAVGTDQGSQLTAMNVEIYVVEDDEVAGSNAEVLNPRATDLRAIIGRRRPMVYNRFENIDHSLLTVIISHKF